MADKIFPASKSATNPSVAAAAAAAKPQIYNAARPVYRSHPHRNRRSCYCYCCLWIIFIIMLLIVISAIAAAVVFLLYRPHRPSFSVSNLQISQFNLTSSNQLNTRFNLTLAASNPNNKMTFYYDPVSVSVNSNGVDVGDGSIPAFVAAKKSTKTLKAVVRGENVDYKSDLKSDLKEKKSLLLKIEMNAKVKVKIGRCESKKAHVRVVCDGIKAVDPRGESATAAVIKNSKCKVDLRIKIWKWTI
ncbi:hypothetical protein L1987_22743 [Smallanthus sonchifolius]|uniref:Uncharacterized protein n=1 Tax=Smallanthus sonchifolius TaxID=185202 RepID=A0ACB9IEZ2_9ASTR|nr:hypothetical protein L1987_22743 [Smallanthus sonchifolius]